MSPWLALIIFIIVVLIVWWALTRTAKTHKPDLEVHKHEEVHAKEEAPAPAVVEAEAPVLPTRLAQVAQTAPLVPDDLTLLEGIGPKINKLLHEAGIVTFAHLAATDVSELKAILDPARLQFIDPSTWAEQAKLAAAGKFDELKVLTDSLKGGRRVK
jgi:predicted flap endonuclease-1-like 5' DNA nuclease